MAGLFSSMFGKRAPEPTPQDQAILDAARRPGLVLSIGGRPKPDTRHTSWWGGNFIAEPPRPGLVPLVQIRADELPQTLAESISADYLVIWIEADPARRTGATLGLEVQRLPSPDPHMLNPVEKACRLDGSLACLPLTAVSPDPVGMLPHPDDAPAPLPAVKMPRTPEDEEPVTFGGWPAWIGPSQWPGNARFSMEIRASQKGRLSLPDDGSFYIFEGADGGWLVLTDGF